MIYKSMICTESFSGFLQSSKTFIHLHSFVAFVIWVRIVFTLALFLNAMIPGISCSAISISLRPYVCCSILRTQKSLSPFEFFWIFSLGDTPSSSELEPKKKKKAIFFWKFPWNRLIFVIPVYDPELRLSWLEADVDLLRYFFFEPTSLVASFRLSSPLALSYKEKSQWNTIRHYDEEGY